MQRILSMQFLRRSRQSRLHNVGTTCTYLAFECVCAQHFALPKTGLKSQLIILEITLDERVDLFRVNEAKYRA